MPDELQGIDRPSPMDEQAEGAPVTAGEARAPRAGRSGKPPSGSAAAHKRKPAAGSTRQASRPSAKAGPRRKAREMALQMLFQGDVGKQTAEQVEKTFWATRDDVDPDVKGFAQDLFRVAMTRAETVDRLIETHAKNWRLERMPAVDRNLLRMAVAEMLGFPRTPGPIIINEALEIGRAYAAPESMRFLNGMLDAIGQALKVPAVLGAAVRGPSGPE